MEMIGLLIAAAEGNKGLEAWIGIIVLAVVLGIILMIVIGSRLREKKRSGRLEVAVAEMGLEFRAIGDPALLTRLGAFPLMNVGRRQELKNLVMGDTSQGQLAMFDFRFITGHGKHQQT
jgi:Na+/melibiose symporter-like transporter